ncbi:fasciclin domain-containing protein [Pontibacter sp. E15-1]|uniref:fasciclin domain-containing protein n=1 Tax=Pontibacter sp. E15-1 TaxID=2919918 RepID=UPI001F4FE9E4|nr:fasciclin domain-containing protein [Pontibacter sp. E15-1]MCJ8165258.1 fasciclin domain-containing protein [Pontibacter sp. E15-1]
MTKTTMLYCACILTLSLWGCGSGGENMKNETQQESTEPTMQSEAAGNGTEPSSGLASENDAGLGATDPDIGGYEMMPSQTIVENVTSNAKLSMLASALRKAEIVEALSGTGPYTLFAPTNDAFEGLPENTLENLMKPENRTQLVGLLRNHVVAGMLKSGQLQDGSTLKTLSGDELKVTRQGNRMRVNGAEVLKDNAMSQNGVIHVVNKVITVSK